MKGSSYIHVISIVIGTIFAKTDHFILFCIYIGWLIYLYLWAHLKRTVIIFSLLIFSLSFYYYSNHLTDINEDHLSKTEFLGKIKSSIQLNEEKVAFTFFDEQINTSILINLYLGDTFTKEKLNQFKYGASCKLKGTLTLPHEATNPGAFDYRSYLQLKNIYYILNIDHESQIHCRGKTLLNDIYELRQKLIDLVNKNFSEKTAQWVIALIFGERSFIDDGVIQRFEQWGLSHLLAISGLHTGIIVGIIYFLLVKLLITTRETAYLLIIFYLPLFALLTGGEPSVWRASLMIVFFLILQRFRIHYHLLDICSVVFIILVIFEPNIIFHIGFQFSFLVTFGLILSSKLLKESQSRLYQGFLISFVAQMIILPLQLYYFYTFQPLSIILNVIVVPYFSLIVIPFAFFMLITLLLPRFITTLFDLLFQEMNDLFLSLLYFVHEYFNYPLLLGELELEHFIIYYFLFILFMNLFERKRLNQAFLVSCTLVIFLTFLAIRPYFSNEGVVTMLDIGQGDAFIIELPYRKAVFFIDIGATITYPNVDVTDYEYELIIKPYLNKRSIYKIDAIFLSHDHIDHYGSLPYIVDDKAIDSIIVSPYFKWDTTLKKKLTEKNLQPINVQANEKLKIKDQLFYILLPDEDFADENENSLVIYTALGPLTWLFTGDIEKRAEDKFIQMYENIEIDVLKVSHHGSDTSTQKSFLQKTNPTYALISVGENNRYNHPSPSVIQNLSDKNIKIFRTDEDGAVQYIYSDDQFIFKRIKNKK